MLEDPQHDAQHQPYFDIKVVNDNSHATLYYERRYSNEPGYPWGSTPDGSWKYTPWQPVELDLTGMGGQSITVSAIAADCGYCAHGGYVYLDAFEGQ